MAGAHYQQTRDSESASFLHDDEAAKPLERRAAGETRLSSSLAVPRFLVYTTILFMFVNFLALVAILHIVSLDGQLHEKIDESSVWTQTLLGKSEQVT